MSSPHTDEIADIVADKMHEFIYNQFERLYFKYPDMYKTFGSLKLSWYRPVLMDEINAEKNQLIALADEFNVNFDHIHEQVVDSYDDYKSMFKESFAPCPKGGVR